ncbi:MAG: hypothetical protein IPN29_14060 [Saprospiraceae bacterium]|nr:hypothetical protein [Saprospiraceae bacterium]
MASIFPSHDKDSWLSRVQKELPEGMSLQDLQIQKPLFTHDGLAFPDENDAVTGYLDVHPWQISASFSDADAGLILEALQMGAEAIAINLNEDLDPAELLMNVRLDFITSAFNLAECSGDYQSKFLEYIHKNYRQGLGERLILASGLTDQTNASFPEGFFLILDWCGFDLEAMQNINEAMRAHLDLCRGRYFVNVTLSDDFYTEVAKLRALRLWFHQLTADLYAQESKLYILATPATQQEDFNHALIRFTYAGLAGLLGGADFISLMPWSNEKQNEARLAQNIQHLFKEESHLDLFRDPFAGSFFMEQLTAGMVASMNGVK